MKALYLLFIAGFILPAAACEKAEPANESEMAAPPADAQVTEAEPGLFETAAIPSDSAVAIAKANTPGRIVKAELENEDGTLIYSFDIAVEGQEGVTELHVDAQTGAVVKMEHEQNEEDEASGDSGS